ncbi:hypothetical protein SMICM304S_07528 [Streptomyces microflavus]
MTKNADTVAARCSGGAAALIAVTAPRNASPWPRPPQSAPATSRGSEASSNEAATRTSPATRTKHPPGRARRSPTRPMSACPAVEARKTEKTTSPARARLWTSSVSAMNAGATAVKRPSRENPAKAASAEGANTPRTWGGTASPCGRSRGRRPEEVTVSGSNQVSTAAAAIRARCTTKGSRRGQGAYSASSPASSGPHPRPPMFAAVAASPALAAPPGGASSITVTVAAPLSSPAANPDSRRPAKRAGSPPSKRKQRALAAEKPRAASRTGRRPVSSETFPARSRVAMTPSA